MTSHHQSPDVNRPLAGSGLRGGGWLNVYVLIGLAALTVVIGGRDIGEGGLSWSDAPLHAMDGVLLHDLAVERPAGGLRDWAEQYYLRYPCLGLIVYYPPLFAAFEAVVYMALGISVLSARLTVLLLTVGAVWTIYLLGRELSGMTAGLTAAVLAVASPGGVAWSRQVMLEWPSVFFITLALLAYVRYLDRPGWAAGTAAMASCAAAYFTKQTAVFVVLLIPLHALWTGRGREPWRRQMAVPAAVVLVLIGGYALATGGYNALAPKLILGEPPMRHVMHGEAWAWYLQPRRLATITGSPLLAGLLGAVAVMVARCVAECVRPARRLAAGQGALPAADAEGGPGTSVMLPGLWLFLWYVICSVFVAKEERYFFFAVPAIALLSAGVLIRLDGQRIFGIGSALLAVLCCVQVFCAAGTPARRLPAMKPTVEFLASQTDADLVLVDALRDGQFVFDVRTDPRARGRIIPMRASKFLYSRAARTQYDYAAHISTPAELYAWLDTYGIRYVVMEDRFPDTPHRSWDAPPRVMLRETVSGNPRFERVFSQPLGGDDPVWRGVNLVTWRYLDAPPRRTDAITIRIPAMDREMTLRLPHLATRPAGP